MIMQDICMYCDLGCGGNVPGSSKHMCLHCLEYVVDKSMYQDINPLDNYKIIYDKNKVTCEMCARPHSLFVDVPLCCKHTRQFFDLYHYDDSDYSYNDYDSEDCYDYEENDKRFGEIKNEIINMLKYSKLTYKVVQTKDENFDFKHSQYMFIYQGDYIVCKFIYEYHRLVLIFGDKIYSTSNFYEKFREMYFGKLNCKLLEINGILDVFKNHFKLKCNRVRNFDDYIKPDDLTSALIERFEILNDPLINVQSGWCECNDCGSYNQATRFIYDSNEILRVISNKLTLSVCIQNKIYTNKKDTCLHLNSNFRDKSDHLGFQDDRIDGSNFKYLNFNIKYNTEYKSFLEIYKLVFNYPSTFKEKKTKENRTWSDITKCNT